MRKRNGFEVAGDNRTCIDAIVGYKFGQRFPRRPKDEVVQFNDGKGGDNLKVRTDAKRHFPFDREIGVSAMTKHLTGMVDLAPKQARMDRPAHAELLDHAWANASALYPATASPAAQRSATSIWTA